MTDLELKQLKFEEEMNLTDQLGPEAGKLSANAQQTFTEKQVARAKEYPKLISATDLLIRKVEIIPTLINPLFQRVGLAFLTGSSDAGKSAFLRQMALAVVNGDERFCGFGINPTHRRAIYVSSEDDEAAMAYLLNKQNQERRYPVENCEGLRYLFDTEDLLQRLDSNLIAEPVDLVVIDAFGDVYSKGSLNESNLVRAYLHPFSELAKRHSCLFVYLHHTGKRSNEREPDKANMLGSQGLEAKARCVIELREDPADPGLRHLCVLKGNYLPVEYKRESFVLRFDECMVFHNTGQRVPFDQLIKTQGTKQEQKDKYERAKAMQEQGMSYRRIGEGLRMSGSAVHKLLNSSPVHRSFTGEQEVNKTVHRSPNPKGEETVNASEPPEKTQGYPLEWDSNA
jgi:hypothetical protein